MRTSRTFDGVIISHDRWLLALIFPQLWLTREHVGTVLVTSASVRWRGDAVGFQLAILGFGVDLTVMR